jgi:ankyrin repeat protein
MEVFDQLLTAIWRRSAKEVERLLRESPGCVNEVSSHGLALLHEAARLNAAKVGNILIDLGAKVDLRGYGGNSPLHEAAMCGAANFCRLLIGRGAEINPYNLNNVTPLGYALFSWADGAPRCVKLLRKAGATEDLLTAIYSGDDDLIADILSQSPRSERIQRQVVNCVPDLLNSWSYEAQRAWTPGADELPIHCEVANRHLPTLDLLLEHGAQLDAEGGILREMAIFTALKASSHKDALVRPLLERGANPNVKNSLGWTPLSLARDTWNHAAVAALESYGAR